MELGKNARIMCLMLAAALLVFTLLGYRDIWTQEHRWADIVSGMFYRNDFLHPYLNENNYYDKPLLSYWLIAGVSYITGHLSMWTMRLPSALAGLLAIWSIYRLGKTLKDERLGLLAGWMLLTTFYFVFWARTSSADMLNMAGSLFAVSWYADTRNQPGFFNYAVFFLILALTSLCKGLVGAVVPLLVILPDLLMGQAWKKHIRWSFLLAMIPAAIVYVMPFLASTHIGGEAYEQSGLYQVYRENVLRYLQPFDHKGPIYTYFIYLPVYMFPWIIFFIPALIQLKSRWKNLSANSKWMAWAVLLLFMFFTLSGSRRSYYVLPIVPFAILMTAEWSLEKAAVWANRVARVFFVGLFLGIGLLQPLYYADGGVQQFAVDLKQNVSKERPWSEWQFVMLDAESKARFYLQLAPDVKNYRVNGSRKEQTQATLLQAWPVLADLQPNRILITRRAYVPLLAKVLPDYRILEARPTLGERILDINNPNEPVAFIPKQ